LTKETRNPNSDPSEKSDRSLWTRTIASADMVSTETYSITLPCSPRETEVRYILYSKSIFFSSGFCYLII